MDTNMDVARAGLHNAAQVLGPILQALQQADAVFGVILNAEKLKHAVEAQTAAAQKELAAVQERLAAAQEEALAQEQRAVAATVDANEVIRKARDDAAATVEAVVADMERRTGEAQAAHDGLVAQMQAEADLLRKELQDQIEALDQRVNALGGEAAELEGRVAKARAAAKAFAESLTGA